MCGRYQFSAYQNTNAAWIVEAVESKYGPGAWKPGDVHPRDMAPVLLAINSGLEAELFTWGYPTGNSPIINARAETAMEKPMFRDSVASRRCVIPSTGFYEWDARRRKYLFRLSGKETLYMAGLYDVYEGKHCFCILTTEANDSVREIHHRMPLVISEEDIHLWLEDGSAAKRILHALPPPLEKSTDEAQLSLW